MKVCLDCHRLTKQSRCEPCRKKRKRAQDKRRPNAAARGYGPKWQRFRDKFLRDFPICGWHEGCIQPATDVHHLDGKGPNGPHGLDRTNCLQLCHAHHSQITAKEQPGGWQS